MRRILKLARFDLRLLLWDKESILWIFIMPVFFMYFTGLMSRGGGSGPPAPRIGIVTEDSGPVTDALAARLEGQGFVVVRSSDPADTLLPRRRLELPQDFSRQTAAGDKAEILLRGVDTGDLSGQLDQSRLRRAVFATIGDMALAAASDSAGNVTAEGLEHVRSLPPAVELQVSQAGERRVVPAGNRQSVPGILVMFMLLSVLTSGSFVLYTERKGGLLRRVASSPVGRMELVLSKLCSRVGMSLVQAAYAMLIGAVLFRIDWGPNIGGLAVLLVFYSIAASALAILLGSEARSPGQAVGIAIVASIVLAALGGCWWPIEVVPEFMQNLALFLPTGWAMQGTHRLVSHGDPLSAALPAIGALALFAMVFVAVGVGRFRYD